MIMHKQWKLFNQVLRAKFNCFLEYLASPDSLDDSLNMNSSQSNVSVESGSFLVICVQFNTQFITRSVMTFLFIERSSIKSWEFVHD